MAFSRWLGAHKSLVATATSGSVVAVLVATVAIVSTGYTAQRLDLGDASVWVANGERQVIGRANTEVLELNTVVSSASADIEVLQSGSTVLLFDRGNSKVDIVDAATSTVLESVPLPPNDPALYLAGSRVVIQEQGTGEVWIQPLADLSSFDAEAESTLSLGTGAVLSVDPDGMLFAFSPSSEKVFRVNASVSDTAEATESVDFGGAATGYAITSVGGRWAVLDSRARVLHTSGGNSDLSSGGAGTGLALQQPSVGGDGVLIGHPGGLLSAPFSGGDPVDLVNGKSGKAAAPLVQDGCSFAAWSGGDAWRQCAGESKDGETLSLDSLQGTAVLSFQRNGGRVVLNDSRGGASWAVQRNAELIDNWDDLIAVEEDQQVQEENEQDVPPELEKAQLPPVAVNDAFGARPGRASTLPVLLNDYDPNGDVLVISEVTAIDESVGRLDLINERQQVLLTLRPEASGVVTFQYTITDGRGGSASATVSVTVRGAEENSPPQQVRSTKASVQVGGRVTTQVLGDWIDPDGDPFYLVSASVPEPDSVSHKPEGMVIYTDAGEGGELKSVSLVVSDGRAEGSGNLSVTVKPAGSVKIIADPFVLLAYAGTERPVEPLLHVRGGTGTLRLNSVPAKAGAVITPSYETGTFRFTSDQVRTHYLEYTVTDGDQTVTGLVRIDVVSPPDANTKPVTVPKNVFVQTLRNARIDVTATDFDPAGGVLLVTGVMNVPSVSGVRAEILEQRIVRVSLDKPLDGGSVDFNYRISNGLAEAEGTITVIEIPVPSRMQPPIAMDDTITVRVGAAIDIPVLANDSHPDNAELQLNPVLAQELPAGSGLLFASGNLLRYLAPEKTGNFTAVYEVLGPDGQAARAQLKIAVREADVATNNAPVPKLVTARVLAGEKVRITVPLSGIDPDGDTVQLLGQETNPEKGSVIDVESDTIVYQAGDYSAGTDTFTYAVIDALGARATGTVRVGISPKLDGARNPVAVADSVTVRPGVSVSVQVLANDSDPDGSPLTVVSVEPNDEVTKAKIVDNLVVVTPPKAPGNYGVIYTIENETGGSSSNFVRVTVDPNAPRARPVARDSVLTLSDILERDTVDVNVLANVFFADGSPTDLGLSIYSGFGANAQVTADKRVRVTVSNKSQIIPFKVTHPDDPSVSSFAFIWVPGFDDALPQIDRGASALTVKSEDELVINLNDHVIAVGGKTVRLTDTSSVRATHSNGSDLVIDEKTLRFTSADKYFGPASISFEVTDGSSASDPDGRKAILVLPITVLPRENQPPVFGGAVIDFEPGQEKEIDLLKLTTYPYPDDAHELAYSVLQPAPQGFTYTLNGQKLMLRADETTPRGTTTAISLGVRDDLAEGKAGRIQLTVVASTRPLAQPAPDNAITKRGQTTTIDVLANDNATNPFPGKPLRVLDIRGLDGSSLPAGVSIQPSADKSTLTATVSADAVPTDVNLQYQVADATNDPERFVWGSVKISIQDRPEPVTNVRVTEFGDSKLTVAWDSGSFNNSPITGYDVVLTRSDNSVFSTTSCTGAQCQVATPGNGEANGVKVSVIAKNAIGSSDPTSLPGVIWSDVVPGAPTNLETVPRDGGLLISWRKPAETTGSSVRQYVIIVGGIQTTVNKPASDPVGTEYTLDTTSPSLGVLPNGSAVTVSVSARNQTIGTPAWNAATTTGTPAGAPLAVGAPSATAAVGDGDSATLTWTGAFGANGRDITAYYAAIYTGSAPSCTVSGSLPGTVNIPAASATLQHLGAAATTTTFTGLSANTSYKLSVFAFNGMGCTQSAEVTATPRAKPGTVTAVTLGGPVPNGNYVWDVTLDNFAIAAGSTDADTFVYELSGASDGSTSGVVSLGAPLVTGNSSHYGKALQVRVKACKTYDGVLLCSTNWSGWFPFSATQVPVKIDMPGLVFLPDADLLALGTGVYSWTGSPSGIYDSVTAYCGDIAAAPISGPGSCSAPETLLSEYPQLEITVTANNTTYTRTYNWYDYD